MTSHRIKSLIYKIFSVVILLILMIPVYMYLSKDVGELRSEYPHAIVFKDEVKFEMRKERPKNWVKLGDVSLYVRSAIVLTEDWSFFQHEGVDFDQMKIALNDMLTEKRFRGASTITQQLIKNVYLSRSKTLWRKLHEMILAHKIERKVSKKRILEIYLNIIEFGPGIYGIGEASRIYFKKRPSEINPREAAFLAMLLPSPKKYYVSFKQKKLTAFAEERVHRILEKMRMGKVLSMSEFEAEKSSRMEWEK